VLALACDERLAARGTYRLGLTEIRAGIPFPAAPLVVVHAELDRDAARRLVLGGSTFGPDDALASAFLDERCAPGALVATAIARAAAAAKLPAYATVKHQHKAEALARIREIVERDDDPMLERWI
jgi:enoyl-CoA hydratase